MVTWKMINLGQVSRNQFWGEPDDGVRRPGICNGVVLFDTEQVVLVDPPYSNEEMLRCLDAHAGLKPKDIDVVYITHAHSDHFDGIHYFPAARWCTGRKPMQVSRFARNMLLISRPTSSKKRPMPVLRGVSFSTPGPSLKSLEEGNKPICSGIPLFCNGQQCHCATFLLINIPGFCGFCKLKSTYL